MTITKGNFEDVVKVSREKPVMIDFFATWCGPCRMLSPAIEQLEREVGESAVIGKVNVDQEPELVRLFKVSSVPTIIVLKDGEVAKRSVGLQSIGALKGMLE